MTSRTGGGIQIEKMVEVPVDPEEGKALLHSSNDPNGSDPTSSSNLNDDHQITTRESGVDDGQSKTVKRKIKRVRKKTVDHSPLIKYGSLVLLVAQLVGLVMLMRYSRTHSNGKDLYLSSTAVFCMEVSVVSYVLKILYCMQVFKN